MGAIEVVTEEIAAATPEKALHQVAVVDIKMPFFSMVIFMVKWVIASIPAMLILFFIAMLFAMIFGAIFSPSHLLSSVR